MTIIYSAGGKRSIEVVMEGFFDTYSKPFFSRLIIR